MNVDVRPRDPDAPWLFDVSGMDCAECARTVEAGVGRLPGVTSATVHFGSGTMSVVPSDGVTEGEILAAVARAGYRALPRSRAVAAATPVWWRERRTLEVIVAALLWVLGLVLHQTGAETAVAGAPFLGAMVLAGYPVIRAAWFSLRARRADMNVLMTVAAFGALPLGEWEEGSSVLILFSLGLLLQRRTLERTRRAVQALMRLTPEEATVLRDGREQRLPVDAVRPGDRVLVRPGERVPVDGIVLSGVSELDQSAITGESIPVEVGGGGRVLAGAMNGGGRLEVEATRPASASMVAGIVRLIEEAQASQAPSQAFVDRFAAIYTPVVVAGAFALAVAGGVWSGEWRDWIFRALVLLVVACPCALVISTPVSLVAAIGSAARRGVLFKGGNTIEALATVRVVAFDKTGTLTHGRPTVEEIVGFSNLPADRLLALAAAVERGATHPIARGIVGAAERDSLPVHAAEDVRSEPGRGVSGRVEGARVDVLNPRALASLRSEQREAIERLQESGAVAVVVLIDGEPAGVIALRDPARDNAASTIRRLRAMGVRSVMLSGDAGRVARRIGGRVGVDEVRAELLPAGKVEAVRELTAQAPVAMVGDGINDAPALATASVGVAMGVAGSDAAIEAAGVALMHDDLTGVPAAIGLARATMRVIRQNVAVSIGVKAVFLLLTLAGVTNLWLAVLADMGTSLLVTLNALRLVRPGWWSADDPAPAPAPDARMAPSAAAD